MINDTFCRGFEGEAEIRFVSGENRLIVWNGYFETMLDSIFDKAEKRGMMEAYCKLEGWYDWEPWLIEDVPLTIRQLSCFDENDSEVATMKDELGKLNSTILSFLQNNIDKKIFIEYD